MPQGFWSYQSKDYPDSVLPFWTEMCTIPVTQRGKDQLCRRVFKSWKRLQISQGSSKHFLFFHPLCFVSLGGFQGGRVRMKHPMTTDLVRMADVCYFPVLWELGKPHLYQLKIIMHILFLVHMVFVCVSFSCLFFLPLDWKQTLWKIKLLFDT